MASISTALAEFVTDMINAGAPYAGELRAHRLPVAHMTREDIEDIQVTVSPGPRTSRWAARARAAIFERVYPVQIVIDYAVETTGNEKADVFWEVTEQIENVLEVAYRAEVAGRVLYLINIEPDPDTSGLTDSQHLVISLLANYKEYA